MESSITVGPASLSDEQQKDLNKQKRAVRINNEKYFRCHPELRTMIKAFMAALADPVRSGHGGHLTIQTNYASRHRNPRHTAERTRGR